jgi:phosphoglycolate phosphatase
MNDLSLHIDLDGTLINTSHALVASYHEAVTHFGGTFTEETEISIRSGEPYEVFLRGCFESLGDQDLEKLHAQKRRSYASHFPITELNHELLCLLLDHDASRSIVTNASKSTTIELLKYHDVYKYFNELVAREDVSSPKPNPEPYLLSMKKNPALIHVAFEDTEIGVNSAFAAGCIVFKVNELD